ncbi:hypothetical protein BU26DRAFT_527802 [Trematosphaeria pertusa]|uniref:Uncharacterized protein n=1 Tax=Trematosphaeria pertusa TaxID=390896 RepID=A0A6A6IWV5_9PLEO|nr:uncharacterized protein BU26DRAFT_527802 [Trematosphaeria pertusa]KAF2254874.1 hypothetical protein BU26DRAFT_527802 [Trematosphaeria pertusa]
MKSFLLLPLLGALALAQTPTDETKCQCPQVKCDASDAVTHANHCVQTLCQCLNNRETLCKEHCPDYVPTYLPCPAKPTSTPTPKPTDPSCVCEEVMCLQMWPDSCYCQNAAKQKCYEKCGGAPPTLQVCPPLSSSKFITRTVLPTKLPPTPTPTKKPWPTHAPCGGGRPNLYQCDEGYICIKDPYKPGCGPECDGLGICVEDKMCGGFAGFGCPQDGQVCVDDYRDDCDPKNGGADCGGLCVWPH